MTTDSADTQLAQPDEEHRLAALTDRQILERFVLDNPELALLEERLRKFNIFEAVGMHGQEIRHSSFLAFLLDPQQPHGLGDEFLKKLLQRALLGVNAERLPVNVVLLHLMSLEETTVERERNNIDILLFNERHNLAVIIENKTGTGEHDSQLSRYYNLIEQQRPGWSVLAFYLTPDKVQPSDSRYLSLSYTDIASLVEDVAESRAAVLGPDVRTLMNHYAQIVRRYLVSDKELDGLCRRIYEKHRRAFNLILSKLPDRQALLNEQLIAMINATPGFHVRWNTKQEIGFNPTEWEVPALQYAEGDDTPSLLLQYHVHNRPTEIKVILWIGPGPVEPRKRLLQMAFEHQPPLKPRSKSLGKRWNSILSIPVLSGALVQDMDITVLMERVQLRWQQSVGSIFPDVNRVLSEQEWIWTQQTSFDTGDETPQELEPTTDDLDE